MLASVSEGIASQRLPKRFESTRRAYLAEVRTGGLHQTTIPRPLPSVENPFATIHAPPFDLARHYLQGVS